MWVKNLALRLAAAGIAVFEVRPGIIRSPREQLLLACILFPLLVFEGDLTGFVTRPISATLLLVFVIVAVAPVAQTLLRRKTAVFGLVVIAIVFGVPAALIPAAAIASARSGCSASLLKLCLWTRKLCSFEASLSNSKLPRGSSSCASRSCQLILCAF